MRWNENGGYRCVKVTRWVSSTAGSTQAFFTVYPSLISFLTLTLANRMERITREQRQGEMMIDSLSSLTDSKI